MNELLQTKHFFYNSSAALRPSEGDHNIKEVIRIKSRKNSGKKISLVNASLKGEAPVEAMTIRLAKQLEPFGMAMEK